jgi:hypothetical protein
MHNLLFLLGTASLSSGCPDDASSGTDDDDNQTSGASTTAGTTTGGTGTSTTTSATTTSGTESSGEATTTTTGADDSTSSTGTTGDETSDTQSATTSAIGMYEICNAYGALVAECYGAQFQSSAVDACNLGLTRFNEQNEACYMVGEDVFSCLSELSCETFMEQLAGCPDECAALHESCADEPEVPIYHCDY